MEFYQIWLNNNKLIMETTKFETFESVRTKNGTSFKIYKELK